MPNIPVQLFAKNTDGSWINLVLHAEDPIKLNLSVSQIQDPLAATSVFSNTFMIPNTGDNSQYFKSVFNVNSIDFDASKKADAYIQYNGEFFANGNIRLNSVIVNDRTKNIEYEIIFYGDTSDFGSKIGGGFLNELDLSQFSHDRTYQNVVNSWSNGLFNGDLVYGLIEWGYDYSENGTPLQSTLSNGFAQSFTQSTHPLSLTQFKPQIRAKALWDKVFERAGYTYDSTFLESDLFKSLYIIHENTAQATLNVDNNFTARSNNSQYTIVGQNIKLNSEIKLTDPGNNWNPNDSSYTAPVTGTYSFRVQLNPYITTSGSNTTYAFVQIKDLATNQQYASTSPISVHDHNNTIDTTLTAVLTAGTKIYLNFFIAPMNMSGAPVEIMGQQLSVYDSPHVLSMQSLMPSNIRIIDFMKSIINRFKLVFVPSRQINNHFTITPWKDWVKLGKAIDWSTKLDTNNNIKIYPAFSTQHRLQIFKDLEDADYLNFGYQQAIKQTYGQLNLDSNNELITDTTMYQDQFAPTPLDTIGIKDGDSNGANFLIPHIAKDSGSTTDNTGSTSITGKREPIQPKLRLVFYNGLQTAPITWYVQNDQNSAVAQTQYPLLSQYSEWPITSQTMDINWQNLPPLYDTKTYNLPKAQTSFASYNVYWKDWYNTIFDPYSRIVEANFVLNYSDIIDLKFNDYVFIKDAWYFVNEIKEYIPGKLSNVTVTLFTVGNNAGIQVPYVSNTQYTPVTLRTSDTACHAYCNINSTSNTYWINNGSFSDATIIYNDPYGSIIANSGIYSDGIRTVHVGATGFIDQTYDTSNCNCVQTSYSFTTKYDLDGCTSCCNGSTVTVYGTNSTWDLNTNLFLDNARTIVAPTGFYKLSTETITLQVNSGSVISQFICSNCSCSTYYPFIVSQGTNLCDACCHINGTTTVYGLNSTWASNTHLYLNNTGSTSVADGYYNQNGSVAVINSGNVSSFQNCTSCTCPGSSIEVDLQLSAITSGYTSTLNLQYSFDGSNWIDKGNVSIVPADSNLNKSITLSVNPGVQIRTILTTNTDSTGSMSSQSYDNNTIINTNSGSTPGTLINSISGTTQSAHTYKFIGTITGGIHPSQTATVYTFGDFKTYNGSASPFSSISDTLKLNQDSTIDSTYNVDGGITSARSYDHPVTYDAIMWNGILVAAGNSFNLYKNNDVPSDFITLNVDGTYNLPLNQYQGINYKTSPYISLATYNNLLYVGGLNGTWDAGLLPEWTTDHKPTHNPYLNSPQIISFDLSAANTNYINTGFACQFPNDPNISITKIEAAHDRIYAIGRGWTNYGSVQTKDLAVMDLTGAPIPTSQFTYPVAGSPSGYPSGEDFTGIGIYNYITTYDNKIYLAGRFSSINGTTIYNFARLNWDGTLDTTFNVGGVGLDLNSTFNRISVDASGIYCSSGNPITYNSVETGKKLIKLNLDGTLNTTFSSPTSTASTIVGSDDVYLYVTDGALLYQLNKVTGHINNSSTESFEAQGVYKALSILTGTNTYTQLNNIYYNASECTALCHSGQSPVANLYGNGITLYNSTILYTDSHGTSAAQSGYYSDGNAVAHVGNNGIIISITYPSATGCGCGTTSYSYLISRANLNATCTACCTNPTRTVYSTSSIWSASTILYNDSALTQPVETGVYNFPTSVPLIVAEANGVVTGIASCDGCCTPDCNNSKSYQITCRNSGGCYYTYTSCAGQFYYGNLNNGDWVITSCTVLSNITVTGNSLISTSSTC